MKKIWQSNHRFEIGDEIPFAALSRHTGEVYEAKAKIIDRYPLDAKGNVWGYTITYHDPDEN